jgi:hypothetical protein
MIQVIQFEVKKFNITAMAQFRENPSTPLVSDQYTEGCRLVWRFFLDFRKCKTGPLEATRH